MGKMKNVKQSVSNCMVFCLVLIIILCSNITTGYAASARTQSITIYTGAVTGSWYPIGGAIAQLVNPLVKSQNYQAGAVPGGGTSNVVAVGNNEGQLGLSYATNLTMARVGKYPYEGTPFPNIYAVANIFDMGHHIGIAVEAGINTLDEFFAAKNINFLPDAATAGSIWIFELIAAEYGLTIKDLQAKGWRFDYGAQAFQSTQYGDKHDIAFNVHTNVPNASTYEMCTARPTVFLEIPEKIRNSLIQKYGMKEVVIPAGVYPGHTKDVKTVTMSCVLFCNDSLPNDIVYTITKALCENKEYLVKVHNSFESFNPQSAASGVGVDLHPGAKKYYEEVGILQK
jgi:TRAP transporter TAXI family solute receptor